MVGRRAGMLVALMFLALSCATPVHQTTGQWVPGMTLVATPKIILIDIADGQERGQEATKGSGQEMVGALRDRLMGHNIAVQTIQSVEIEKGYEEAARLGFDYVLRGVFTNWEDNATAWSGNPDRADFTIEIYSVPDKRLAGSASHRVQASGFTMMSGTPMRFIPELADNTLARLFGWPTVE
jgi:hypothetical protein